MFPVLHRPAQIPRPGPQIRLGLEQIFHAKMVDFIFAGPFVGREFTDLHQAALSGSADLVRVEPALAPNDRFHQHWVELMLGRD